MEIIITESQKTIAWN